MKLFSQEIESYIREHKGVESHELISRVNSKFGTSFTYAQLRSWRKNHNCPSGYDSHFKKSHTPWTKGKKQTDYMTPAQIEKSCKNLFKKGNVPHNFLGDGAEVQRPCHKNRAFVRVDGKWLQKHRVVYEKAHKEKLKRTDVILFADRNVNNLDPANLIKVSRQESSAMSKYKEVSPENYKACIAVVKLQNAIKNKEQHCE